MNYSVLVKLEGVMVNEFNVEEIYEKGLRRRFGINKEVEDEVSEIINPLKEKKEKEIEMNKKFVEREIEKINNNLNDLREKRKRINGDSCLEKEEKDSEKQIIDNRIKELLEKREDLKNYFKNLRLSIKEMISNEEEKVREEISEERSKELDPIREREKEIVMKELIKEYDENFENLKLRRGVKEVFDRLFKLKMKYKELRIIVESEYRSLKVRRLLKNLGLDFCEVVNSSVEGWDNELNEEGELLIKVENVDDLTFLVEKVKYEIDLKKRLRA